MKKMVPLFLFLPAVLFLSWNDDEQFIDWSTEKRLDWNDFLAAPTKSSDAAALTATHLGFSYSYTNNHVTYNIVCRFDKTKSWGLVKNEWILKHEQGHFDIAEIFARKLNKTVSEYVINRRTFQKDLDKIYRSVMAEKEVYQHAYDNGTDFSRSRRNQLDWYKKIQEDLKSLESWANYR